MKVTVESKTPGFTRFENMNKGDVFTTTDGKMEILWMKTVKNGVKDSVCLNDGTLSEASNGTFLLLNAEVIVKGVK
jgi:hypothetical protein